MSNLKFKNFRKSLCSRPDITFLWWFSLLKRRFSERCPPHKSVEAALAELIEEDGGNPTDRRRYFALRLNPFVNVRHVYSRLVGIKTSIHKA